MAIRFNEIVFRFIEIAIRFNEIVFRFFEIIFRFIEIKKYIEYDTYRAPYDIL